MKYFGNDGSDFSLRILLSRFGKIDRITSNTRGPNLKVSERNIRLMIVEKRNMRGRERLNTIMIQKNRNRAEGKARERVRFKREKWR